MPNDRNRLLDRLHNALRDEYLAAYCYRIQGETAGAVGHVDLAKRLLSIADAHQRHVAIVENRIVELGGEPNLFRPPAEVIERMRSLPHEDICGALEFDLKAEDTEIETYETIAGQSDSNTAELCFAFSEENRRHANWLRAELVKGRDLDDEIREGD